MNVDNKEKLEMKDDSKVNTIENLNAEKKETSIEELNKRSQEPQLNPVSETMKKKSSKKKNKKTPNVPLKEGNGNKLEEKESVKSDVNEPDPSSKNNNNKQNQSAVATTANEQSSFGKSNKNQKQNKSAVATTTNEQNSSGKSSKNQKQNKSAVGIDVKEPNQEDKQKDLDTVNTDNVNIDSAIEEVKEKLESDTRQDGSGTDYTPSENPSSIGHQILKTFENLLLIFIIILILAFTIFTIKSVDNTTIASGISILGIDVSDLSKSDAIEKITTEISNSLANNIILKHDDFETNITPEQIEASFDIESAVDAAFDAGTGSNAFTNSFKKIRLLVSPIDITPSLSINEEQLQTTLSDISTQLPDAVIQSTYYIEDENLIITSGQSGVVIDTETTEQLIVNHLSDLSFVDTPIEMVTIEQEPETPDLDQIYAEIKKDPVDAYYTTDPYVVYPEQNGLDLAISLDEAKALLDASEGECTIPLQTLYPSVTTNMIGMEAFPDLLSSFSTKYSTSDTNRTTNLILASDKINGTVLLPGETFSYNTVVGERTIAAGYKEAAMYQDGEVVDGLGGGICQISTTLYNAALYANLEITERRNHQFVPSYVDAGRDATVVYGSQDFKFTNNRNYAIKIVCSVSNGVAKFEIYGLRESTDYEVVLSSKITSRTSSYIYSETYKTLKQNGQVVSSETISKDTYKVQ